MRKLILSIGKKLGEKQDQRKEKKTAGIAKTPGDLCHHNSSSSLHWELIR